MCIHQYSDPLVLLLHSEGWMASPSVSSAACSAAHPAQAASQPSWPSCPLSPHIPFSQIRNQAPWQQGQQGHQANGLGVEHQSLEVQGLLRANGSFIWQNELSFSTRRESWIQWRCSSLGPAEGIKSAACIFAVFQMPGELFKRFSVSIQTCLIYLFYHTVRRLQNPIPLSRQLPSNAVSKSIPSFTRPSSLSSPAE